jgi:hypothetical protein
MQGRIIEQSTTDIKFLVMILTDDVKHKLNSF